MELNIIVAATENNVIGVDSKMPWRLSNDLQRFKKLTWGGAVVMGRKTYQSMGKALPGRTNIVLTRDAGFAPTDAVVVHNIEEALVEARKAEQVFVIGGGEIYKQFWNRAHRIYLTRVHAQLEGDTVIPEIDTEGWVMESSESFPADEKNQYPYTFINYKKKEVL
ncbi:dihydrofolate reductase [Bacteroides sp. OttesenSCG-928-D19]|nr:dihydrofolate reductase [Bacteroides sp. OttesenSCG-928-N06]MDL2306234.1 dihydrofolate reductase [Bacteroides sp. OttesenSCG-928-D19]